MTEIIKFISKIPHVAARALWHAKHDERLKAPGCGNLSQFSSWDCQESYYFLVSYEILTSSYASLKTNALYFKCARQTALLVRQIDLTHG